MKLKAIHCYSYVRFQAKNENFLTVKADMPDLEIEVMANNLVSVKSSKDHIIVSWTNIAYALPFDEATKDVKVPNRGKLLNNEPSSPKKL